MFSLPSLTAALAFAGAVGATPVDLQKRKAFSVQQVERGQYVKNGPQQLAKTFRKFGKEAPSHVVAAASAQASGSAPANPGDQYDSLYLTPVTLGNTTVQLDLDTGSADLWVFSNLQPQAQLSGHDYYKVDPSKKLQNASWKITYGDGSGASGTVYADKVVVGGVTATTQAIEAATSVSTQFQQDQDTDGLLGLAFSKLNTVKPTQQKTWFDTIKSTLAKPIFAVTLKYHTAGTYDFGFIDSSKYTGDITYVPVDTTNGFWEFAATGYKVGSGAEKKVTIDAIADTGTTLLYLPAAIVKDYYSQVQGAQNSAEQGGYVFPCRATPPDLSITIGGKAQVVPGKYIVYAPVDSTNTSCFGGVQADTGIGFSIFGDIFLKSKYVVHELTDSPRLGFAQQAGL